MPILIIHGEHVAHSRHQLTESVDQAKREGKEVTRLMATNLDVPLLEQSLGESSLFGNPKVIIIEELHSLPTSAKKKSLIEILATQAADPQSPDIILWEKRSLTKTMVGKFAHAKANEYKISKSIFTWLDSLSGLKTGKSRQVTLLHQALQEEDEWYCAIMLARQIRLLIQAKEGKFAGAPFMIAKLKKQAASFTEEQLHRAHQSLLEIDKKHKTSTHTLSLVQDLDLLLLRL